MQQLHQFKKQPNQTKQPTKGIQRFSLLKSLKI